jgi:hypothetical protein
MLDWPIDRLTGLTELMSFPVFGWHFFGFYEKNGMIFVDIGNFLYFCTNIIRNNHYETTILYYRVIENQV